MLSKTQYVEKSRTSNHRKDVNSPKHAVILKRMIITYETSEVHSNRTREASNVSKDALRLQLKRLKRQKDFWINKLQTLIPKGLNQELNNF